MGPKRFTTCPLQNTKCYAPRYYYYQCVHESIYSSSSLVSERLVLTDNKIYKSTLPPATYAPRQVPNGPNGSVSLVLLPKLTQAAKESKHHTKLSINTPPNYII